jgi:hypothetical protein
MALQRRCKRQGVGRIRARWRGCPGRKIQNIGSQAKKGLRCLSCAGIIRRLDANEDAMGYSWYLAAHLGLVMTKELQVHLPQTHSRVPPPARASRVL